MAQRSVALERALIQADAFANMPPKGSPCNGGRTCFSNVSSKDEMCQPVTGLQADADRPWAPPSATPLLVDGRGMLQKPAERRQGRLQEECAVGHPLRLALHAIEGSLAQFILKLLNLLAERGAAAPTRPRIGQFTRKT